MAELEFAIRQSSLGAHVGLLHVGADHYVPGEAMIEQGNRRNYSEVEHCRLSWIRTIRIVCLGGYQDMELHSQEECVQRQETSPGSLGFSLGEAIAKSLRMLMKVKVTGNLKDWQRQRGKEI